MRGNDKPSEEHYAPDGTTVIKQRWLIRSGQWMVLHRGNDLPAIIEYDPTTKNIIEEHWFINGVPARADPNKPTSIFYTAYGDQYETKYATPSKFVQKNIPTDPIDGYIMQMNDYLRSQLTKEITSLAGLLELANEYMATHPTKDGKDLRAMFPFPRSYFLAKTGDVATVQIRSVLDVIFVQHAAQQQLQIKNLPASLLDAALMQNLDGLAADILTKLLEELDPSDAEAMTAFRAYLEPKNLRRNPSSSAYPYLRRKRAGISESTYSLLDTAYNMLVSDVGLDYMRNYKALRDLHLTTNKERHQTSDGVPRITLLIDAHGSDLFTGTTGTPSSEKPQKYHFEGFDGDEPGAGKLSVLFLGPGECDVETYDFVDGSTADKWRRMIWSDAIPHDHPNVDEMMVKLRPKLHEMYVGRHALKHRLSGYDVPRQVNDGEGGKTPWQDRSYSCNDPAERQPNFAPGIVQIVQSFNNPKFDKFVGATLFSAALTAASPNVDDDAARTMVNQWYKDKLLKDGMIKRLRLSQILKLCRAMGYKDVNVFDKACRSMVGDAPTKKKLRAVNASIKDADFRKRQVAEVRRLEDRWPPALPPMPEDDDEEEVDKDDDENVTDMWSKLAVQQRRRSSSSSSSGVRTPSPTGGGTQKRRRTTAAAAAATKSHRRRRGR